MNITEIYNMKVNMGLLDLKKYNNLINEIENVPQKYIDVFDLKNIGNKLKEELKLNNTMDLDEIVELYSQVILIFIQHLEIHLVSLNLNLIKLGFKLD